MQRRPLAARNGSSNMRHSMLLRASVRAHVPVQRAARRTWNIRSTASAESGSTSSTDSEFDDVAAIAAARPTTAAATTSSSGANSGPPSALKSAKSVIGEMYARLQTPGGAAGDGGAAAAAPPSKPAASGLDSRRIVVRVTTPEVRLRGLVVPALELEGTGATVKEAEAQAYRAAMRYFQNAGYLPPPGSGDAATEAVVAQHATGGDGSATAARVNDGSSGGGELAPLVSATTEACSDAAPCSLCRELRWRALELPRVRVDWPSAFWSEQPLRAARALLRDGGGVGDDCELVEPNAAVPGGRVLTLAPGSSTNNTEPPLQAVVIDNARDAAAALRWLRESLKPPGAPLSIDLEWRPEGLRGTKTRGGPRAALVQLSSPTRAVLLRTCTMGWRLPTGYSELLTERDRTVVAQGFDGADDAIMRKTFGFGGAAFALLDLQTATKGLSFKRTGLQAQAQSLLHDSYAKSRALQRSDWEAPALNARQVRYAALDALMPLHALSALREVHMRYASSSSTPPPCCAACGLPFGAPVRPPKLYVCATRGCASAPFTRFGEYASHCAQSRHAATIAPAECDACGRKHFLTGDAAQASALATAARRAAATVAAAAAAAAAAASASAKASAAAAVG